MKKWIFSAILIAVVATFAFITLPARQVQAACGVVLSGSFATNSNVTTPNFPVSVGDVITATVVDNPGSATGIGADISINGSVVSTPGQTSNGSRTTTVTAATSGTGSVFMYNNMGTGGTLSYTITISGPNCPDLTFTDGRVNPQAWATAVIYCNDGAIEVYDVDLESKGQLLFVITPEEIAEVGVPASNNALIESGNGVRGFVGVYRQASGDFIVVAPDHQPGKDYTFTWAGC